MENRIPHQALYDFTVRALKKVGVTDEQAGPVATIILEADLRAIPSHGIARLKRYLDSVKKGEVDIQAVPAVEKESGATAVVNAKNAFGHIAGIFGMQKAISLAKVHGIGAVTVHSSTHYGIAGYYAEMALPNMIGCAMTNASPMVVPMKGKQPILGSNPIAVAAPSDEYYPWSMDFATSTVSMGKIEVRKREGRKTDEDWAINKNGEAWTDPAEILDGLKKRSGGGITSAGGHKGYGFGTLIEILSGVLSGSAFGTETYSGKHPNLGHFFMAIDIERFMPIGNFKTRLSSLIRMLTGPNSENTWVHGKREVDARKINIENGIPILSETQEMLENIARELGIE